MKRIVLHGFFARVYWNWGPLMVDLDVQHETHCTTWPFCTCILELNASDGGSRGTTWNALYYMSFLHVYSGIECLWRLIQGYYMKRIILHEICARVCWNWMPLMVDLGVLHETHCTTWDFCTCILDLNVSDGGSRGTTWNALYYMSFWSICCQRHLLDRWLILHDFLHTTWPFCMCILESTTYYGWWWI